MHHEDREDPEDRKENKTKKGELKSCNYSGNIINLHISPRARDREEAGGERVESEGRDKEPDKGQSSHENTSIFPQFDQEIREEI